MGGILKTTIFVINKIKRLTLQKNIKHGIINGIIAKYTPIDL
jgi:hypothetical protein